MKKGKNPGRLWWYHAYCGGVLTHVFVRAMVFSNQLFLPPSS